MKFAGSNQSELLATPGCAALEVELVFGQSTATTAFATSPLKLLTPRARGKSVWAYTSSFGGGLVAGDQTQLEVRLGAGTRCFVGTQASTKVYRNPSSLPCGHVTRATLDADSILVFAPDPVQAFADSSYTQQQEFKLDQESGLVLVDWFTSGRAARGERWAFKSFQSRNEVFIDGQRVFLDSLLLDPDDGALTEAQRLGRFNCLAMLLMIGAPLHAVGEAIIKNVSHQPVGKREALICTASPVRDGTVVRLAGESVEAVGRELHRLLTFAADILGDDPWARKW
ncbi:MAG: urease accessory protein UreD [Akkermansiaceae bacterium]|nr:urease accessory protein UreD [Verrucomicrobiales bacterium]